MIVEVYAKWGNVCVCVCGARARARVCVRPRACACVCARVRVCARVWELKNLPITLNQPLNPETTRQGKLN